MKRIINTIKRIYNNIKYILSRDIYVEVDNLQGCINILSGDIIELSKLVDDNYDKLDDRYYSLDNSIEDIMRDMYDKLDYDGVVDCIYDNPDNDIKEDVKELKVLCDVLTRNNDLLMEKDKLNNDSIDNLIERDLLVNEVIQAIINKLERNANV